MAPAPVVGAPVAGATAADTPVAAAMFPLFPVATHKFVVLSICTFGLYEIYWFYQNWKRIKAASGEKLRPIWRSIFAPLWGFSLFGRIRILAASRGVPTVWQPTVLGILYLVLCGLYRLPDPWWLISLASFMPLIPVQLTAQRVNESSVGVTEARDDRYQGWDIAIIVVGGLLIVLGVLGTFLPESSPASAPPAVTPASADTAGLHDFRVWLDREHKGYGCDVGPAEFRNKTVAAAYPGVRFYYVLTYTRGIQPPFPNSISLVARVDTAGTVSRLNAYSPETFQPGLLKIRSAADARLDAAAVLILAMGGEGRWKVAPDSITVRKKKGWVCTYQHGNAMYTSEIAFDKKGRVRSIAVNSPPVP